MSTRPPVSIRFIPTLTEVAEPVPVPLPVPLPSNAAIDDETLINTTVLAMSALISHKLTALTEKTVQELLNKHLENLASGLKPELEAIVRQAIHQTRLSAIKPDEQK